MTSRRERIPHPMVTVVADIPSPYQNVFFDEVAALGDLDIEVLYCRKELPERAAWAGLRPSRVRHRFLPQCAIGRWSTNPTLVPRLLARPRRLPVLIGYYLPSLLLAGLALGTLRRRWIFWTDTLPPPVAPRGTASRLAASARRYFIERSTVCLTTGNTGRRSVLEHGVSDDRVRVLPFVVNQRRIASDVDAERSRREEIRAGLGLPGHACVLLYVGQLIERKGLDVLVAALARVRAARGEEAERLVALIVGDGPVAERLRDEVRQQDLGGVVRFIPTVPNPQLAVYWAAADAFVLPSRFDAWPVVVMEACAAGLPVVGTDGCGSVRDCILHGETGWVVPAGDAASLADRLWEVATLDAGQLRAMGEAARSSIDWASPHAAAREFVAVVKDALA